MRVAIIETGIIAEYEEAYAIRLIEQGKAVLEDEYTPVTPVPLPGMDLEEAGQRIIALEGRNLILETSLTALRKEHTDAVVFANMYQSIAQAQERKLADDTAQLQEQAAVAAGS